MGSNSILVKLEHFTWDPHNISHHTYTWHHTRPYPLSRTVPFSLFPFLHLLPFSSILSLLLSFPLHLEDTNSSVLVISRAKKKSNILFLSSRANAAVMIGFHYSCIQFSTVTINFNFFFMLACKHFYFFYYFLFQLEWVVGFLPFFFWVFSFPKVWLVLHGHMVHALDQKKGFIFILSNWFPRSLATFPMWFELLEFTFYLFIYICMSTFNKRGSLSRMKRLFDHHSVISGAALFDLSAGPLASSLMPVLILNHVIEKYVICDGYLCNVQNSTNQIRHF